MNLKHFGLAVAAATAFVISPLKAQLTSNVEANIPFAFRVGDATMPAGKYIVSPLDEGQIEVSAVSGKPSAVYIVETTSADQPAGKTELIFHRYGNQEFLSQLVLEGEQEGLALPASKAEKELMEIGQKAVTHSHPATRSKLSKRVAKRPRTS